MIPKIIHYCWFGGNPLPVQAQKCIDSWKKYCPDYTIKQWDETNFDLSYCTYVKEAVESKKWAFVTDVVRLYALFNEGGVYMDSDVEVLKPLDDILKYKAISGFQDKDYIPTGIMASEKGHHLIKELLDQYNDIHFIKPDGSLDMTTNCVRITDTLLAKGLVLNNTLQEVDEFTLFPLDYFCAKDVITGKVNITSNTYTIHHFAGSWTTASNRRNTKIHCWFMRLFGEKIGTSIYNVIRKIKNRRKK